MIGIAARSGVALGMNLLKKNDTLDAKSREAQTNLWWSVVRLEHLLSVMTGRISCLGDASSSAPPPTPMSTFSHAGTFTPDPINEPSLHIEDLQWSINLNKEQMESQRNFLKSIVPSPSLCFFYIVDLSLITHAITNKVYATDISRAGWGRVESRISFYSKKMDCWATNLHPSLSFEDSDQNHLPESKSSFQISLALHYYSTRIILNRPCLNRPAFDKNSGIRLARSRFSNKSALACLRASLAVLMLLPDQPDLNWCYEVVQWWDLLHILTQATVILLLDISIGPAPTRPEQVAVPVESTKVVVNNLKKGLSWLHCLGNTSEAARRAFKFCHSCIHRMAASKGLNLNDIPSPASLDRSSKDTSQTGMEGFQHEEQPVSHPQNPRPGNYPYFSTDEESSGRLFQDLQMDQSPIYGQRNSLTLDDSDYGMTEFLPHMTDTDGDIEEALLHMMGHFQ